MRKTAHRNAPDLHVHSTFSLLDGLGTPEAIVKRAVELGWGAAALTDHGWMGGVPAFYRACRAHKIKPIIGCEMYVVPGEILGINTKETRSESRHLTVLALSREGYENLIAWNNEAMKREHFYYRPRISVERMIEIAPWPLHHNVVLSGCMGSELCQAILNNNGLAHEAGIAYIDSMKAVFPNFFIEIQDHEIPRLADRGLDAYNELLAREELLQAWLFVLANETATDIVVTNDSHYQRSEQRKAHIAMLASKMNSWSKADTHYGSSQEHVVKGYIRDYAYWANYMRSMEPIADKLGSYTAIETMLDIVKESDIILDPLDRFSYSIPFSGESDPLRAIRDRCKSRLKQLVRKHGAEASERFDRELQAMGDFAHYLVMVADLCQWCRSEGILTNTRGSAANSVVCYCLKIHQIDPIEYRLTFERFVNPERKKLPDIDLDIERDRYDDVIKFMQGYIEEREGSDQFAQIGNYGTLANRSTFRMVAESLGIEKETIDEVAKLLPQMIDSGLVDEEEDAYAALKEQYPEIYDLAAGVFDSIKNVSQHACGWAVGTKDRPLKQWVPLYLIASSGAFVTQYDYKTYEWFGLTKLDLLRLKTLSVVKRCLTMLGKDALDLQQIPLDDPETFAMMRAGKTDGVFTLQGKTNRQGVMEVEAQTVHDVIASVAIYRPSLTRPGYHRVYNARRRGEETVSYPSDAAERVLGESYGLPIFQEQILDLAKAIGFSDAESQDYLDAIKLAKGVGRGAKEAFDKLRDPFIQRATDNGLSDEEAEGTWDLVSSFQGYGFNRGHATSYGRLAVRAAYLKCHHPQEFFTSLLDVYPEVGRYVAAAKGDGFRILAPDANRSGVGFSRGEDAQSIRVGFTRIKGVGVTAARALVSGQPYASLDDLRSRTPSQAVNAKTITILGEVGALKNFGIRASASESRQFELLSFLLEKPGALEGIEYRPKSRSTETWRFAGRTSGVEITEARTSVAKLFWIPEIENVLTLKASPWARVKSYLLTAVDENGIGFDIACQEDRAEEANYLKFIAKHCQGAAICMEGQIKQPFDRDRPMMFRFFDVAGTHQERPAVWGIDDKKVMTAFNVLHRRKMAARRSK